MRIRRNRNGFTLIELLVVIAIIGLLISLLLPAFHKARQKAKAVVCGTHLRQLGVANELYLNTFNSLPGHKWKLSSGEKVRQPDAVAIFLRSGKLQLCPAVRGWAVGKNNSYGYNYKYLGSLRKNHASPTAPFERFPVTRVNAPAKTIAYADSDGTGWTKDYTLDPDLGDPDTLGHHGYTLDPTFIPVFSLETVNTEGHADPYAFRRHRSYISDRHAGRSNAVWVDGHVSPIHPREVYRDNRSWNGLGREDPRMDPHVPDRHGAGTFRYQKLLEQSP